MKRRTEGRPSHLLAVLAGLTIAGAPCGLTAIAQEQGQPTRTPPPLEQVSPTLSQAWDTFQARYGNDWHVEWDFAAAVPRKLYGPGIHMTDQPLDGNLVDALARNFLDLNRALYRADDLVLAGNPELHGTVWYLNYGLAYRGVPLDEASRIDFRFKPNGTLAMVAAYRLPRRFEGAIEADIPFQTAVIAAEETLPVEGGPYVLKAEPVLQIHVDKAAFAEFVWRFELRNNRFDLPIARDFSVHAVGSPDILESRQRIFEVDVTGNVKGNTHITDPMTAIQPQNLADIRVAIVGGSSTFTDASGNFTIPNAGSSAVSLIVGNATTAYSGRFAQTANQSGANTTFTTSATPGTPVNVVLNGTPSELPTAEADGYRSTDHVHTYVVGIIGETFGLNTAWPVNVNLGQTCNAYYDGVSTNFFRAGGGCNNTAYQNVCAHEYGHAIDDRIMGITDGALSEGIGDMVANFLEGDPIIGRNFFTNGNSIRDANNTRLWPASECGGEVHCVGEVFMGFTWKARVNLIATLGAGPGTAKAEQIMFQSLAGNGPSIPDQVVDIYVQDDDDGNLNNGVPDQTDLDAAADFHNLPHPRPVFISISHTPLPSNTMNSSVPYAVVATITTTSGSINGANLRYSLNGAAYQTVAMAPTGNPNEYSGDIPAQPCGTSISYYLSASDTMSHSANLPIDAPATTFSFSVGIATRVFFDNFETAGDNGWTHGMTRQQDDWQHGVPNQSGANPYDPHTAYSGTKVWGNDLAPTGFDGNYQNNVSNFLNSPSINNSGHAGTHLRYRRWLTVEDGIYDHARIKINGTVVWENPGGTGTNQFIDTSWVDHDLNISAQADNQAALTISYTLDSDPGLTFGGWNIDDVSLETRSNSASVSMSVTNPTPAIGQPDTFNFSGTPNATVILLLSRFTGSDSFQVPGGPNVVTGLQAPQSRGTVTLDGSGAASLTRSVPNRPLLSGRTFQLQAVNTACDGSTSAVLAMTIQ